MNARLQEDARGNGKETKPPLFHTPDQARTFAERQKLQKFQINDSEAASLSAKRADVLGEGAELQTCSRH